MMQLFSDYDSLMSSQPVSFVLFVPLPYKSQDASNSYNITDHDPEHTADRREKPQIALGVCVILRSGEMEGVQPERRHDE